MVCKAYSALHVQSLKRACVVGDKHVWVKLVADKSIFLRGSGAARGDPGRRS